MFGSVGRLCGCRRANARRASVRRTRCETTKSIGRTRWGLWCRERAKDARDHEPHLGTDDRRDAPPSAHTSGPPTHTNHNVATRAASGAGLPGGATAVRVICAAIAKRWFSIIARPRTRFFFFRRSTHHHSSPLLRLRSNGTRV